MWVKQTVLVLVVACVGALPLSGCASKSESAGASAGRGEVVTESDESAERKRARIRIELAVGYFEQGKTTIALDEIKQAIVADPAFSDAYSLRGLIYMRLNDYAIAEESFNKALSIAPRNADVMHNLGWLKCQQAAYRPAFALFEKALAEPLYLEKAKTLRALGLCQERAGMLAEAQASLLKSYEYDAGNPVTGYNLANLLFKNGDLPRAQFYIRRLNNSELANAESLWLGMKIEKRLANLDVVQQLATQLERRFPQSVQAALYRRGAFNE
jgi:type IV pilus assembly protein PilF